MKEYKKSEEMLKIKKKKFKKVPEIPKKHSLPNEK